MSEGKRVSVGHIDRGVSDPNAQRITRRTLLLIGIMTPGPTEKRNGRAASLRIVRTFWW